jgi:hypothetical protein
LFGLTRRLVIKSEEGMTMVNRKTVLAFVMAGVMMAATSYAFVNTRVNNLTFSRSVQLPGVRLAAGAYSFEVLDPGVGIDIVRVWDREHTRIYYTGITRMVALPRGGQPNRVVVFGEALEGGVPPILVWYPIGSPKGHEFVYTQQ